MTGLYFNEVVTVRLRTVELERVEAEVKRHKDKYNNSSDFIRAATNNFLRLKETERRRTK